MLSRLFFWIFGDFFLRPRINRIITIAVITTNRQTAMIGAITERTETVVEVTSSAILTGVLPAPPVVSVTAGRIISDLTAWTLPETNKPENQGQDWIYIGNIGCGCSENNGTCSRPHKALDYIINMVHLRNFISQYFNDREKDQCSDHPPGSHGIPGRTKADQIGIPCQQRNQQQGDTRRWLIVQMLK